MHHFHYKKGELFCEDVPVKDITERVGTPFYLYSTATLTRHFRAFDDAFSGHEHIICFAVKSCSNLAVLKLLCGLGAGADIVSGGELYRALKAGIPAEKIVFSGVGKTKKDINEAIKAGILMFNVESEPELDMIHSLAKSLKKKAQIAIRVNPDVDAKTHPYISTGLKKNKFGVPVEQAVELYLKAAGMDGLHVVGIDCHIGSQLTNIQPFLDAASRIKILMERLEDNGIKLQYIDLGGGLGIRYGEETPPEPKEYAARLFELLKDIPQTIIIEPGRAMAGNAAILVTKLLYIKDNGYKKFYVVDAGMNDLARPSLYGAYHHIQSVEEVDSPYTTVDVVGPICETGDFLAKDRDLPELEPESLLAVMSAGAYGFSMSSNYNSRPRCPEVLVKGDVFEVIRKRETYQDLVKGEKIPSFCK